jgi:hypothetical protein
MLLRVDSATWGEEQSFVVETKLECIGALCEKLGPSSSTLDGQGALAVMKELLFSENLVAPDSESMLNHILRPERVKTLMGWLVNTAEPD